MFENKLDIFEKRYNELNNKLYDPTVAADPELYQKIMKEFKEIEPIVEEYQVYKQAKATIEESLELLNDSDTDKEMKELAEEELAQARATMAESQQNIKILLLPKDPNDDRNVIVEIRGGAGGEEAALF
ncbi:MAG: PCRF domain-containing protein, partial [Acutalibacteraceae bacterium]|nr:PCRF domain-containing protein [Acutalibacteraceae bacterium]